MITTQLTRTFDLRYPIVLAPMGNVSGGLLAAAVTNAGGLGLVGAGYGERDWLRRELAIVREQARGPWGVGFITWALPGWLLEIALMHKPHAVMLSFGDPQPHAERIRRAGCKLLCQVQNLEQARMARDAGADFIVAQGAEAGGHGGTRATLPLVPAVVDEVQPVPVIAAGGIADGRGLAAALMLGAEGALLGTRFYACEEALGHAAAKQCIVAASGDRTRRTRVFDIVRGHTWPGKYTGRALRNEFLERWHGSEKELERTLYVSRLAYQAAAREGDCDTAVVWAGEAVDLIERVESAAALVQRIGIEAESRLHAGHALAQEPDDAQTGTPTPAPALRRSG